jgi:hypothetical protein
MILVYFIFIVDREKNNFFSKTFLEIFVYSCFRILIFKYAVYILRYMKNSVIAIQSLVITTILHSLLVPVFFEMDNNNVFGEQRANFVDDDKTMMMYSQQQQQQQQVDTIACKSPCPESAEMCIAMCT